MPNPNKTPWLYALLFFLLMLLSPRLLAFCSVFQWLGGALAQYLEPFKGVVLSQFLKNAHIRLGMFCWVVGIHCIWIRFVDPLYKIKIHSLRASLQYYTLGVVLAFCLVFVPLMVLLLVAKVPYQFHVVPKQLLLNIAFVGGLSFCTAATEELIFRQYLLKRLASYGLHYAVFVQAAVFGLAHCAAGVRRVLSTALAGLFLGYGRVYTQHLAFPIGCHTGLHLLRLLSLTLKIDTTNHQTLFHYLNLLDNNFYGLIGQMPLLLGSWVLAKKAKSYE